uniref:Uncharacterized protein n=1 Tax=Meloidogyne incognita TaxID=6306 RepID=A0A914L4G4_MELIC
MPYSSAPNKAATITSRPEHDKKLEVQCGSVNHSSPTTCSCTTVMARNSNMICTSFSHPCRNNTNSCL